MGVYLAPQLAQDFRKGFGDGMRLRFADQPIELCEQCTVLGVDFGQAQQQILIQGLPAR
jgi:hypothetical protein